MIVLTVGDATARVDPQAGGHLTPLVVGGAEHQVSGAKRDDPVRWGWRPIAPWAGRLRQGRRHLDGRTHPLPIDAEPHAIHGTVYRRGRVVDEEGSMATGLGADRPFAGHARQRITLEPGRLRYGLEPQPGTPDGPHVAPRVVEPDAPLVLSMDLSWPA